MEYLILDDKKRIKELKKELKQLRRKVRKENPNEQKAKKSARQKRHRERKQRYIVVGKVGNECNRCGVVMERRKHKEPPKNKTWYYTQWDYCDNTQCPKTVQHYDEFKTEAWKEAERVDNFMSSL